MWREENVSLVEDVQRGCLKENKNKRAESLTVKALDPFSPFISLAPNIKHAMEETKYWVRHNNTLATALLNTTVHISRYIRYQIIYALFLFQ